MVELPVVEIHIKYLFFQRAEVRVRDMFVRRDLPVWRRARDRLSVNVQRVGLTMIPSAARMACHTRMNVG